MPIRKKRLNKIESIFYVRCLNQLSAEGFDFGEAEIPNAQKCPVMISTGGSKGWAKAFGANTVYGIWLRLAALAPAEIESVEIRSSFDTFSIDLPFISNRKGFCHFAGTQYRSRDLLNEYFDRSFRMSEGKMVEGLLLAYGAVSIPEQLKGKRTEISITLVDVLGREVEETITIEVLRYQSNLPFASAAAQSKRGSLRADPAAEKLNSETGRDSEKLLPFVKRREREEENTTKRKE
jgi:hypothetical protein